MDTGTWIALGWGATAWIAVVVVWAIELRARRAEYRRAVAIDAVEQLVGGMHTWACDTDGIHEDAIPAFVNGLEVAGIGHTISVNEDGDWRYRIDRAWLDRRQGRHAYTPSYRVPPGETLEEELRARGWSVARFASMTGVGERTIRGIIAGTEPITPIVAQQFARELGTSREFWLNLEANYRKPVEVAK